MNLTLNIAFVKYKNRIDSKSRQPKSCNKKRRIFVNTPELVAKPQGVGKTGKARFTHRFST